LFAGAGDDTAEEHHLAADVGTRLAPAAGSSRPLSQADGLDDLFHEFRPQRGASVITVGQHVFYC